MRKLLYWSVYFVMSLFILIMLLPVQESKTSTRGQLQDFLGRSIDIPETKPLRIVSLAPSITEILFAVGAGDRVVGVTTYCDFPEQAKKLPKVGGFQSPDIETIVMMRPDLVLASGQMHYQTIRALEKAGIRVAAIEPQTMEEVLKAIRLIGSLVHEEANGEKLAGELAQKLQNIRTLHAGSDKRRVFVEIWDVPLLTVGAKSYIHDVIVQAGGVNVAGARQVDYLPSDFETLYAYNPDTYLVVRHGVYGKKTEVFTKFQLNDIQAVRENRIFYVSDDFLARPGPRSFAALEEVAAILHSSTKSGSER